MRKPPQVGAIANWNVHGTPAVRAFTLIDIMVSLSVVVLLISLLLPTLASAQEATRRMVCASNLRQQGIAIQNFALSNAEQMPSSIFDSPRRNAEHSVEETIFLRLDQAKRVDAFRRGNARRVPSLIESTDTKLVWDGLGKLYSEEYVNHHSCFYCPSHHGSHPEQLYRSRFLDTSTHISQVSREIAGNFQLRLGLGKKRISDLNPSYALVTDAVRSQVDYNHITGNNLFRADLSVSWFADSTRELWNVLAANDKEGSSALRSSVVKAWLILDGDDHRRR